MRIEAYTQVQQLYNAKKPVKTQGQTRTASSDKIQISSIESFAEKLMRKYEEIESL